MHVRLPVKRRSRHPARATTRVAWSTVLAALFCAPHVGAQGVSSPAADVADDDPVELSPFTVSATQDRGYQAANTLAGTRIRTDLADVGSSISVLTRDFLDDLGATDNQTVLAYALNTEVGGARGNFSGASMSLEDANEESAFASPGGNNRVRGLTSADNTRNFFLTSVPWDGYNVSRIDLQRGPNAILFGLGSPAGIVNATTEPADFRGNRGEVTVRTDQFGSWRTSLNYNAILVPDQLSVRVAALNDEQKFRQEPAFEDDRRVYGAVSFRPKALNSSSTYFQASANFEHGRIRSNQPRSVTPLDFFTPFYLPRTDDPTTSGAGQQVVDHYTQSAAAVANPWIASFDLSFNRGPRFVYNGAQGGPQWHAGDLSTFGSRTNTGAISNTEANIYGGAFRELAFRSYPDYANAAGLPFASAGAYVGRGLSDPSVFDFYNQLIDGPNKREWNDWDFFEANISHTFLRNKLGYDLSFFREEAERGQAAFLGFQNALYVDINTRNVDGTPNPNVGRVFVQEDTYGGNQVSYTDHDAFRAQVFGEHDFSEGDSFLSRFVGRQRITGVYQRDDQDRETRQFMRLAAGPDFAALAGQQDFDAVRWRPNLRYYLTGDTRGRPSAEGLNLPNVRDSIFPSGGSTGIRYFDTTWAPPAGVNPGDVWEGPGVPVPSGTYNRQSQNPANYVGWRDGTFTLVDALDGTQASLDYATRTANLARFDVDSYVAVYQGYFLNNGLVLTYGWREDQYKSASLEAGSSTLLRPDSGADVDPSRFNFESPSTKRFTGTTHTTNWSAVAHLHKLFNDPTWLPLNVSFFYNRGEAFQPLAGRVDGFGHELPPPEGSTEDYGILLATKDQRFSLRLTRYRTEIINASSPANISSRFFQLEQSLWSPAGTYARYRDGLLQASSHPDPQRFTDVIAPAYVNFLNQLEERYPDFVSFWTTAGQLTPARGGPTIGPDVRVARPAIHSFTEDQVSKGWEIELTANPTRNWRISVNASRSEATRSNIPDAAFEEVIQFIADAYLNTPAGEMPPFNNLANAPIRTGPWAGFTGAYIYLKALDGQPQPEVRKWRGSLVTNYSFTEGRLRGVGVGAAVRYTSRGTVGFPYVEEPPPGQSAPTLGGNPLPTLDLTRPYRTDAETPADFWISYSRPITDKIDWRIQLNVYNAFGHNKVIPLNVQADGSPGMFRIQEGRSWALTNTFSF